MAGMSLGTLVCCGIAVPITRMRMTGGKLVLTGGRPGPVPATRGPVVIYGDDGGEVMRGGLLQWEEAPPGVPLSVNLELTFPVAGTAVIPGQVLEGGGQAAIGRGPVRAITA